MRKVLAIFIVTGLLFASCNSSSSPLDRNISKTDFAKDLKAIKEVETDIDSLDFAALSMTVSLGSVYAKDDFEKMTYRQMLEPIKKQRIEMQEEMNKALK